MFSYHSYYTEGNKYYGENASILTEYTKDYKELKYEDGSQRTFFLGYKLDDNNKIIKAYTCGLYNNKLFCLEPGKENIDKNKKILKDIFGSEKCYEFDSSGGKTFACGQVKKEMTGSVAEIGTVIVGDIPGGCNIYADDKEIACYESQLTNE